MPTVYLFNLFMRDRLADAGYVTLTMTYRAKQPIGDLQDVVVGLDWLARQAGIDGLIAETAHKIPKSANPQKL